MHYLSLQRSILFKLMFLIYSAFYRFSYFDEMNSIIETQFNVQKAIESKPNHNKR